MKIIKNIRKLMMLLLSSFKKNFSNEYYTNKNIKSMFYLNGYAQTEGTLNELEGSTTLTKSEAQFTKNDNSKQNIISTQPKFNQNITEASGQSEVPPKQTKKTENLINKFSIRESEQSDVNAKLSTQKLKLPKEGKPLEIRLPYGNTNSVALCSIEETEKVITRQPKKLSENSNLSRIKQELEIKLANPLEFNNKGDTLLSSKSGVQKKKQACREDVLPLISNVKDTLALPVEQKIKPITSSDNNPPIPPPPPIGGLANFKGSKLPLSSPIQKHSRAEQEERCNIFQNKTVSIGSNLDNSFVKELTLKLEKRKSKAHSV